MSEQSPAPGNPKNDSPVDVSVRALAAALLFDTLSAGFRYPDAGLYATLADGRYPQTLTAALTELDEPAGWASLTDALHTGIAATLTHGHAQLESDFIARFDSNRSDPPVRPYAHLHAATQEPQVMLLRRLQALYHAHGVDIATGPNAEQADHLCVQLDFLALLHQRLHLALTHAETTEADKLKKTIQCFRVELDWIKQFAETLESKPDHDFYSPLTRLLLFCITNIHAHD